MNSTESISNNIRKKNDYKKLHKSMKARCEQISKDNDALSSRLINLKLLICKAENQNRNLQERLEKHGIDYHAAITAYSTNDFLKETGENELAVKTAKQQRSKPGKRNQAKLVEVKEDPGI